MFSRRAMLPLVAFALLLTTPSCDEDDSGERGSGGADSSFGDGGSTGSKTGGTSSVSSSGCGAQVIPPDLTGGCAARLVTPNVCEEIDLTGGKTYEVAWTTDGTGCETPWRLCIAGNPLTDANSACADLSTNVEAGISKTGGLYYMTANDLAGLSSDNGVYHGLVASFYGSHHGTVAFRVKK